MSNVLLQMCVIYEVIILGICTVFKALCIIILYQPYVVDEYCYSILQVVVCVCG